jgi:hypothetical protein
MAKNRDAGGLAAIAACGVAALCAFACTGDDGAGQTADAAAGVDATPDAGAGDTPAVDPGPVVRRPPFVPRRIAHFSKLFYPDGPAEQPAPAPGPGEADVRALLTATLARRAGLPAERAAAAGALFDDPTLVRLAPAPSLRAALLLLRGTAGDAAIEAVAGGAFTGVRFGAGHPCCPNTSAWVEASGARGTIVVADWAAREDPRALAAVLAHESLHSDVPVNGKEEAICSALEAVIYGQLVLESPDIARAGTRLTRANNTRLLERLNSRDQAGKLRLTVSSGYTLPRSQAGYGFMIEFYEPFAGDTPGNLALTAMLQAVTGTRPAAAAFNNAAVELLDQQQVALSAADVVALASALELDTDAPAETAPPARAASAVTGAPAPPAAPGEAAARETLKRMPFVPRNAALFDRAAYPAAPPDVPAAGPALTAAAARALVEETLARRFGAGDARLAAALAAFDGPALAAAVPDPALRAALLCLRGTAADTVVEALAAGVFTGITFIEAVPELPFATALPPPAGKRPVLAVNGTLRFEDPRHLAPFIAAAALQEDASKTPKELLVGRALVPLFYAQLLLETPALARAGTQLARVLNRVLLARLNSRDAEGRLRLLTSTGNVYPASAGVLPSYLGAFVPYGPDTPGGRTLWDMVAVATRTPGFEGNFGAETFRLLDQQQALLTAEQVVALARTLELDVP